MLSPKTGDQLVRRRFWSANFLCAAGGDIGFFRRGDLHSEFETAAFELELGGLSEVIKTPVGYHVIQRLY